MVNIVLVSFQYLAILWMLGPFCPHVKSIFESMNTDLPTLTSLIMTTSSIISGALGWLAAIISLSFSRRCCLCRESDQSNLYCSTKCKCPAIICPISNFYDLHINSHTNANFSVWCELINTTKTFRSTLLIYEPKWKCILTILIPFIIFKCV